MNDHEMRMLEVPLVQETERLILRVLQPGDGEEVTAAKADSIERLRPWFPWAQEVGSVDDNELWARGMYVDFWNRTSVGRVIQLPGSDSSIGTVGLHIRKTDPVIWEIGYWLRTGYEGKGYMTEAVQACTKLAFENLKADKIVIRADSRNIPSQKVAERCGYHYDGKKRWYERDAMDPEKLIDMHYYSLQRSEYEGGGEK